MISIRVTKYIFFALKVKSFINTKFSAYKKAPIYVS